MAAATNFISTCAFDSFFPIITKIIKFEKECVTPQCLFLWNRTEDVFLISDKCLASRFNLRYIRKGVGSTYDFVFTAPTHYFKLDVESSKHNKIVDDVLISVWTADELKKVHTDDQKLKKYVNINKNCRFFIISFEHTRKNI